MEISLRLENVQNWKIMWTLWTLMMKMNLSWAREVLKFTMLSMKHLKKHQSWQFRTISKVAVKTTGSVSMVNCSLLINLTTRLNTFSSMIMLSLMTTASLTAATWSPENKSQSKKRKTCITWEFRPKERSKNLTISWSVLMSVLQSVMKTSACTSQPAWFNKRTTLLLGINSKTPPTRSTY